MNPVKKVALKVNAPNSSLVRFWETKRAQVEECLYNQSNKKTKDENLKNLVLETKKEVLATKLKFANFRKEYSNSENAEDSLAKIIEFSNQTPLLIRQIIALSFDEKSLEKELFKGLNEYLTELIKDNLITHQKRVDGRQLNQTRQITCQINVLGMTHGSSLFQRGETQVLNIMTLGTGEDHQKLDNMEDFEETYKDYIHHYNFPSYSVGEIGRYFGPGRREIGHGNLAEKALLPVLPSNLDFPYFIRTVSECLGSNGSTSMASTCASSLSLLAGGVPIKAPVAGVAMGLALDEKSGNFAVLTDIQGLEDHHADMDFKVTGTSTGVTAIQLDNKIGGLTPAILKQALFEARAGRLHILEVMNQTISQPADDISPHAPRVRILLVPNDKIRDVIGSGGAIINGLEQEFGVKIDLDNDTGKCSIYSPNLTNVDNCYDRIYKIVRGFQNGDKVIGKIFRIENYGVFVKIDNTDKESMVHVSQLGINRQTEVSSKYKIGDIIQLEVTGQNEKGQLELRLAKS